MKYIKIISDNLFSEGKKKCSVCGQIKTIEEFYKNKKGRNGFDYQCVKCALKKKSEYDIKNKDKTRKYYLDNKERIDARNKSYYENNKEKARERWSRWNKNRKLNNPGYRLNRNMKSVINQSLKGSKNGQSWTKLVGYDTQELKEHLESQFKEGMTWDNREKWEIDHIIPVSLFNIKGVKSSGFKKCWALENLRPLWKHENRAKRNKLFI